MEQDDGTSEPKEAEQKGDHKKRKAASSVGEEAEQKGDNKKRQAANKNRWISALTLYRRWLASAIGGDITVEKRVVEAREADMGFDLAGDRRAWHSFVGDVGGGARKVKREGGAMVEVMSELKRVDAKLSERYLL